MLVLAQFPFWLTAVLTALFLFVCLLMILTVLIQRPAGGGLSGAFGSGAGSGQTAFGAKTGDALTVATIAIFVIYLLFAVGLNFAARPTTGLALPPTAQDAAPGATTGSAPAGGTGATAPTGAPAATGATGATAPTTQPATPPAPTGSVAPTGAPPPADTPAAPAPTPGPAPVPPPAPTGPTGPT